MEGKQPFSQAHSFSNASSQNFETVVLLSIVEQSSNYVFWDIRYVNLP